MADARIDVPARAAELEGKAALEILTWASRTVGPKLTFATGFGAEGCVIIDAIARTGLEIDLFTLDTGVLFPETYALWRRLEDHYAVKIRAVRPARTIAEQEIDHGPRLWERDPDRCCELRKVEPLRQALAGFGGWVTAIRRDQTPERANAPVVSWDGRFGLVKINPLVRWTFDEVKAYAAAHDVPYNPLHDQGYPSIGCVPCTSQVKPGEDPRSGRWRGNEKTECGLHLREVKT